MTETGTSFLIADHREYAVWESRSAKERVNSTSCVQVVIGNSPRGKYRSELLVILIQESHALSACLI